MYTELFANTDASGPSHGLPRRPRSPDEVQLNTLPNSQEKRVGTIRLRPLAFSTGQTERSPRYLVPDVPLDGQSEGVLHLQRPSSSTVPAVSCTRSTITVRRGSPRLLDEHSHRRPSDR